MVIYDFDHDVWQFENNLFLHAIIWIQHNQIKFLDHTLSFTSDKVKHPVTIFVHEVKNNVYLILQQFQFFYCHILHPFLFCEIFNITNLGYGLLVYWQFIQQLPNSDTLLWLFIQNLENNCINILFFLELFQKYLTGFMLGISWSFKSSSNVDCWSF